MSFHRSILVAIATVFAVGMAPAAFAGAVLLAILVTLWYVLPLGLRLRARR